MESSLFGPSGPLASRMRPRNLEEVVGQSKSIAEGSPIYMLAQPADGKTQSMTSLVLWGPPGTGKTTLAKVVAASSGRRFIELSAVSTGVKELREVIDKARTDQELYSVATIVFLDEIHRFSKAQQDALLPAVEAGWIVLIAATTENPSFSVNSALLSRSLVVRLEPLTKDEIAAVLKRAIAHPAGFQGKISIEDQALHRICEISGGDARRALTILEVSAARASATSKTEEPEVSLEDVASSLESSLVRYDRDGEEHYDTISAFIKSIRGSDADAAVHYLARMLEGGEDPVFIARRLLILASEDIGLADNRALPLAVAGFDTVSRIGMPEARIALSQVTIYLALAPKSNSAYVAINQALEDVRGGFLPEIPLYLRSSASARVGQSQEYIYPHDHQPSLVEQTYVPGIRDYFRPKNIGEERTLSERWEAIKAIVRKKKG